MSDGDFVLRRVQPETFKTIPLHAVESDSELSWKAVGMHTYMISRPPEWSFYRGDLVNRHTDGRDGVKSGLRELTEAGYLRRKPAPGGGWLWWISEVPLTESEWAPILEGGKSADGNDAGGEPGRIPETTPQQEERRRGTSKRARRRSPDYDSEPGFVALWALPGTHGAKYLAFEEYVKAKRDGVLPADEELQAKWTAYVEVAERKDFTPAHLFRWLRDNRWEEKVEPGAGPAESGYDWENDGLLEGGDEAAA